MHLIHMDFISNKKGARHELAPPTTQTVESTHLILRDPTLRHHYKQQCLYFFPLPHGHGSLRPTFGAARRVGVDCSVFDRDQYL